MPARHWSIWSLTPDRSRWIEVEEDLSEREATITAEQRTKIAAEHGIPETQYIALPKGEQPGPEHVIPANDLKQGETIRLEASGTFPNATTLTAEERVGPILGVNTPPHPVWYADPDQVLQFARVLVRADHLDSIDHVLDYFEKPYNWDPEHAKYVEQGSPWPDAFMGTGAEYARWDRFVMALNS
jgi:hypothetical protein